MSFNQIKNKISTFFETSIKQQSELENRKNKDNKLFFDKSFLKAPISLYEEDIIVSSTKTITSTESQKPLPSTIEYSSSFDLEIPDFYLQYLNLKTIITPQDGTEIVSSGVFEQSSFGGTGTIEILGDGSRLYIGSQNIAQPMSNESIQGMPVPLSHGKEMYDVNLNLSDGSNVTQLFTLFIKTVVSGTPGVFDIFRFDPTLCNNHVITSISSSSISYIGQKYQINTLGGYIPGSLTNDVALVSSFNSVLPGNIQINSYFDVGTFAQPIFFTGQSFELVGRHLYYNSEFNGLIGIFDTGIPEGNTTEIILSPIPVSQLPPPSIFPPDDCSSFPTLPPYTTISLVREANPSIVKNNVFLNSKNENNLSFFKVASTDDPNVNKYRFRIKGSTVLLSNKTEIDPNSPSYTVYNDLYTVVGTGYQRTTKDHSFETKNQYIASSEDVNVNIKLFFNNSQIYSETRHIDLGQFTI